MVRDQEEASAIRFFLDDVIHTVDAIAPTTTLLEYLREGLHRIGTKEGCAEGDCGACTVVLATLDSNNTVRFSNINACITFLPTLDGTVLFTVESLKRLNSDSSPGASSPLHPVQQAMVDHHGSQCGFCTPGFVMTLFALYQSRLAELVSADAAGGTENHSDNSTPSSTPSSTHSSTHSSTLNSTESFPLSFPLSLRQALAGNLCRCTGYRPILEAAEDLLSPLQTSGVEGSGQAIRDDQSTFINRITGQLQQIQVNRDKTLVSGVQEYWAPNSLESLLGRLQRCPQATILAGGTDIGLWVTKQDRLLEQIIYIGNVQELSGIHITGAAMEICAATSLRESFQALLEWYPELNEIFERFASPGIRHAGTLCGNIANGSPIGDSMPCLIALGATLTLCSSGQERSLPLEDFYHGYQETDLKPGELVKSVVVPKPLPRAKLRVYKISKRYDQDISSLLGAFWVYQDGGLIRDVRICFGGMAATPQRAHYAEQALVHKPWAAESFEAAAHALARDYRPITDMRASAHYRSRVASNLLDQFFQDCNE